jgi:phosphoglycolate phosphatase-like HAD superfamily hydrolase
MSWIAKYYIHSNIKMVVCGLGGTIINDLRYSYQPFYHSLKKYGINKNTFPSEEHLHLYGRDKCVVVHDIVNQVYPEEKEATKVLQDIYRDIRHQKHIIHDYPRKAEFINSNIPETLVKMREKGLKVVLTSAYPKKIGDKIVKDLNLDHCFDNYLFNEDNTFSTNKPSVERIRFFMEQYNIASPSEIVKVGSNISDLVEGNLIHCGVNIAVLTGYDYEDELIETGADYIINDLSNIIVDIDDLYN